MNNKAPDPQSADGEKKTYIAPQLRDLDTIKSTEGKSAHFVETNSDTFGPS